MGYKLIFIAAALWGLIGVFTKGILAAGVEPLEIAFWRASLGGVLFCIHAGMTGQLYLKQGRDLGVLFGFALVGIVHYAAFAFAVNHGGVNLATILLTAAPALAALGAWCWLNERLTRNKFVLVLLTLLGVLLVSGGGGEGVSITNASLTWGLLASATHASLFLLDKWILGRYTPVTICAFMMIFGALMLGPLVSFGAKSLQVWLLLLLLVIFSTYLAYFLYYTGLKTVEVSRAVLVVSIEPVVAASLAAVVFGERFGLLGLCGAVLIGFAAVMVSLPEGKLQGWLNHIAFQRPLRKGL